MPVRSSWIQAMRWSWLIDGLVLADQCSIVTVVLRRDFFATTKKVRIAVRVVGPEASHSSTSCWVHVAAVRLWVSSRGAVRRPIDSSDAIRRLLDIMSLIGQLV